MDKNFRYYCLIYVFTRLLYASTTSSCFSQTYLVFHYMIIKLLYRTINLILLNTLIFRFYSLYLLYLIMYLEKEILDDICIFVGILYNSFPHPSSSYNVLDMYLLDNFQIYH